MLFSFFSFFPSLPFPSLFFSFLSSTLLSSPLLSFFLCLLTFSSPAGRMFTAKGSKLTPVSEDFPQLNRSKPIGKLYIPTPKAPTSTAQDSHQSTTDWNEGIQKLARLPHGGEWLCFSSCSRASCGVRRKAVLRAKPHLSWLALLPHPASLSPLLLRALPSVHHFHQVSSSGSSS